MSKIAVQRAEGEKRLKANWSVLTSDEKKLIKVLREADQIHLFGSWDEPGVNDDLKHKFLAQLAHIDKKFSLVGYATRARKLLKANLEDANPYEGWEPTLPTGYRMQTKTAEDRAKFDDYEKNGIENVGQAAFVLVAGGLGERLSYPFIKVSLPVETTTETPYLQYYCQNILALQDRANRLNKKKGLPLITIPFAIMTSGDTDAPTRKMLAENKNFGMAPGQITVMMQDKVPAMSDLDAHYVLDHKNKYQLMTKPHGHGDVHLLLHQFGLAEKWTQQGKKWIVFFQDTNCLAFRIVPSAIGVSARHELDVNSIAVRRKIADASGALVRLVRKDNPNMALTINVEYNQVTNLMKTEPLDEEGYSLYPGNINLLVYHLPPYAANLKKTGGIISEFINPKYANKEKTIFKKDTRLECMMQDYPKILAGTNARVSYTMYERWVSYATVKNSLEDARTKQAQNLALECASSGENYFYRSVRKIIHDRCGVKIDAEGKPMELAGVTVPVGPAVVVSPSFGVTQAEIASKFGPNVQISPRSTLVLLGQNITIKSLKLDGCLIVRAPAGTKVVIDGLVVKNKGWKYRPLYYGEKADAKYAVRGYTMERLECKEINGTPVAKL